MNESPIAENAASNPASNQEAGSQKQRLTLLAANLLVIAACAFGLLLIIAAYLFYRSRLPETVLDPTVTLIPSRTPSPVPSRTLTPTFTFTPRPTSSVTPSLTPVPSGSPAASPTITPVPSLTPAKALAYKGAYKLQEWTAELADDLVNLIQGYPAGLLPTGEDPSAYYQSFTYPVFAAEEALLRFPDDPLADNWRWTLAYDLALTGDPASGEEYAALIADNLNRQQVTIPELYAWFIIHEPRLEFFMVEVQPPPNVYRSYLIELRSDAGSSFIWLRETPSAFQAFSLFTDFDFTEPRTANWILADLDHEPSNGEEVAIYFSSLPAETTLMPPQVFNLSKNTPLSLGFAPEVTLFDLGMEFQNYWRVREDEYFKNELVFSSTVYPPCPLDAELAYQWSGVYFKLIRSGVIQSDLPAELGVCDPLFEQVAHFWGASDAVGIMETLSPYWPPLEDSEGEPYPPDELDAFRFQLAIYKLLAGDEPGAIELFNQISTDPVIPTSTWIEPAQAFLADYQSPDDLYSACRVAPFCDPSAAIEIMTERIPSTADPLATLKEWEVEVVASGYFDFEDDDTSERWFTVRNTPQGALDFWLLVPAGGYQHAVRVGTVSSRSPTLTYIEPAYIAEEGLPYQPAVLLDGKISFSLRRYPDTRLPYLMTIPLRDEYPSRFLVPLEAYKQALFAGASPELIQQELEDMEDHPGLLCQSTWSCDEYGYLLGLAAELANDAESAVQAYQNLWLNYSKSPFTAMARSKLVPSGEQLTPTSSPTSTIPATVTPPTVSVSPTPSATGTLPTVTPLITPTPTITGTPPTATPTVTGTPPTATPSRTPGGPTPTATTAGTPYPWLRSPTPYP